MTEPNKWELAGRLANALRKLDARRVARHAKVETCYDAERASIEAGYPAEVVAMVETEEHANAEK